MVSGLLVRFVTASPAESCPPQRRTGSGTRHPPEPPRRPRAQALTPEVRGDIFMARKMYREAIDTYKTGARGLGGAGEQNRNRLSSVARSGSAKKILRAGHQAGPQVCRGDQQSGNRLLRPEILSAGDRRSTRRLCASEAGFGVDSEQPGHRVFRPQELRRKRSRRIRRRWRSIRRCSSGAARRACCCRNAASRSARSFTTIWRRRTPRRAMNDLALLYIRKALEEGFKEREKFTKRPGVRGAARTIPSSSSSWRWSKRSSEANLPICLRPASSGVLDRACDVLPSSRAAGDPHRNSSV